MTAPSTQQNAEAAGPATPKAKGKIDQLLSPVSETKSPELEEDDLAVENTWDAVQSTAVCPARLPKGADLVLVSVPLGIDITQLEGAEMVFPSDSLETGRLGNTVEVATVQDGADTGVHLLGIDEGVPSSMKVAALYSVQYSLPDPDAEEGAIDFEALEALRAGAQEPPAVAKKKKKKKKRKEETDNHTSINAVASTPADREKRYSEKSEEFVASVSKKDKGKKTKKKRKHAEITSQLKSHPVDAIDSLEAPSEYTPVKKKKNTY